MKKNGWGQTNRFISSLLAVPLLFLGALPGAAETGAGLVKNLTRSAQFVFRGTIERTGAANLSIVEPDAKTAIVRVDEVLKTGGTLDDFTGREITVFLSEPRKTGDQGVFFTNVRLLGESLGVDEVGRASGSAAELAAQVEGARGEIANEGLAARVAAADLIVAGRVLETRAIDAGGKEAPSTEHDPLWREAVLQVSSVLKGKAVEKTVAFRYPSSVDVMWALAPKPSPGQTGTWLLHRRTSESGASVYAAFDPQDLMSAAEAKIAERWVNP